MENNLSSRMYCSNRQTGFISATRTIRALAGMLAIPLLLLISAKSLAAPVIEIEIRDHLFFPAEVNIPANTKVKLLIINTDPTPEEFESYELNREKVITGKSKAVIFVGPLAPGKYPFFGEFNPNTAQGVLVAQ